MDTASMSLKEMFAQSSDEDENEETVSEGDEDEVRQQFDGMEIECCRTAFGRSGADESGSVLWGAGIVLAQYLKAEMGRGFLNSEVTFLELGCGLALPSLSAAKYGAKFVSATDASAKVLRRLKRNTERNGLSIQASQFDWAESPDKLGRFDIVLASDVIYSEEQAHTLAPIINATTKNAFIFAARDGRRGEATFLDQLSTFGFRPVHTQRHCLDQGNDTLQSLHFQKDQIQRERLTEAPYTIRVFRRLDHILSALAEKRRELADCKHQMTQLQQDLRTLSTTFQHDIQSLIGTLQQQQAPTGMYQDTRISHASPTSIERTENKVE